MNLRFYRCVGLQALLLYTITAAGQFECGGIEELGQQNALNCTRVGEAWLQTFKWQDSYIPSALLNNSGEKTVKVAIHVWQDADGNGNFPQNQATVNGLTQSVEYLNTDMWTNNDAPSDPISGVSFIPDTKLRAELVGVYFHQNQAIFDTQCANMTAMNNAAILAYPEVERCINLHIARPTCWNSENSYANYVATPNYDAHSAVRTKARPNEPPVPAHYGGIWSHEIGHLLGLWHTYQFLSQNEHCVRTHDDFLEDVFGDGPEDQPWCSAPLPACEVCLHDISWNCDVNDPSNSCTNNMMGGTSSSGYFSPLQIGRMHRTLALYSARKYAWGFSETPYVLQNDETWDFNIKFYQDVVIPSGTTLTVQCIVEMVPQAKVVVQPGGRLIIDGGTFTAAQYSDEFWGGIEVWGTSNQHQYPIDNPTHQGLVVLTNGAVIEHAREAIRLWKPQDWNSMGGVVQVKGTSGNPGALFLNCRRSVEFMAYQNFQPGNPSLLRPNFSSFTYADFKVDDDYRGGHDFEAHVTMWGVDGIVFRACNFENAQTTGPNSWQLGEGIFSLDANYSVGANCTVALPYGVPCPPENLDRGTVKGLGHGIDARDSGSGRGFAVGSLDFENNVVGIYAEGLPGFSAMKNTFVVGNRNAELVGAVDGYFHENHHRGISTQQSYGFRIEENDIVRADDVLAEGVDGIVIENSGPHSTEVYANTARDLDNGYIGEGNCIDGFSASSVGHQFLCNQNLGNGQNFWVRNDDGNTSFHSIRTQQGSKDIPAGNTFDQSSDERDYKNETSWVINYWHSGGNEEPIYVTPGWLVTTQTNDASGCPSRSEGRELRLTPELTSEVRNDFDVAKEAYISTAYVYKSLLDGGNTQAVVDEVQESWPQEAWDLRNYLMSKSPYLSTTVLMEVMKKNTLPQAMVLEICLANPEATKKESFIKWAEYEAPNPLPGYMIDLIAGSWDERTFRMELEAQMGQHHADMSVASDILQASYRADEENIPFADMLDQWNKMPNYGARFAEVEMHLRMKQFEQAKAILNSLAARYTLKEEREAERDRAIWYIDRLQGLAGEGRSIMQFNATELAELTTFAETTSDIPGTWVRNILCFGYQICLPHGEGVGGGNKALKPRKDVPNTTTERVLEVMPNPASAWATIAYDLGMETSEGYVRIIDARGKEVALLPAMAAKGQLLWDTRTVPSGVYAIELFRSKERVSTRRLVVQPAP